MVELVKMGREWEIETKADYDKAMEILDGNEFCAEMSDDFFNYRREMTEISRQRANVRLIARKKGIIK